MGLIGPLKWSGVLNEPAQKESAVYISFGYVNSVLFLSNTNQGVNNMQKK